MDYNYLSNLIQYDSISIPNTMNEFQQFHYQICNAADADFEKLMRIKIYFMEVSRKHLESFLKDKDSEETRDFEQQRDEVFERMQSLFLDKIGVDLTKNHTIDDVFYQLFEKHSEAIVIKRLFLEELEESFKLFISDQDLKQELKHAFFEIGVEANTAYGLVKALRVEDKESCIVAYNKAYKAIERELQSNFEETMVEPQGSCKLPLSALVENLRSMNQFREVEDTFNLQQLFFIPVIMLLKAVMSQALNRHLKEVA
ncbi:hypothetical protein A0H77_19445 [Vibrio alginolyticus]|uniref:hypothetical protein n=1 Tax=Vibrio alginolyticus TaxID=663 RepID=UPI0007974C91|nr:hypothetical protein [Vibrio alginolyticus]KXZ35073.1 hypothetical protein A0H77_19445 [Vibrio alginolyticus]